MSALVDPTPIETLASVIALVAFLTLLVACVIGLSLRAMAYARKQNAGKVNAEVDARIVVAQNVHMHGDPTAPTAEYGAVRATKQVFDRRR